MRIEQCELHRKSPQSAKEVIDQALAELQSPGDADRCPHCAIVVLRRQLDERDKKIAELEDVLAEDGK
jgi:hypothetical protein